jgi:membrane-associated phospholipid phosphatase
MTQSLRAGARPWLAAMTLALLASNAHAQGDRPLWNAVSSGVYPMVGLGELALLTDGHQGRKAAWQGLEALSVTVAGTEGLKFAVGEKRPRSNDHDSFPSEHAAVSFAMAEVIHLYDPRYAPLAFGAAALISYSRVRLDQHYWQDVVAGAALGYVSAHFLAYHHVSLTPRSIAYSTTF